MNMINILFFISGCALTSFVFMVLKKRKKTPINQLNFGRRGLIHNKYSASSRIDPSMPESVEAVIEIIEIDSSDTKSKVKVLEIIINKSKYNTTAWKERVKSMTDNSWVESSEIEWIKSKSTERAEKLDKILN